MPKFFAGIRIRLILLVLLAVLPALGLILYTDLEERQQEALRTETELLRLVRLGAVEEGRLIDNAHQLLIALAQLPSVRAGALATPAAKQAQIECQALFADLLAQYPFYTAFTAATPDGQVFCSAPPLTQPVNFADRAWYQRLRQTHDFVTSGYLIGRISGKAVQVMAYPVLNAAGGLQAIVTIGLDLAWFNYLATQAELPPGSTFTVIDRNGTILARSPDPKVWVGRAMSEASIVEIVLAQGEGTAMATGLDGVNRLYGFTPLSGAPERETYINIGIPTEVAFASANQMLRRNLTLLGLAAAAAFIAAWLGSDLFFLRRVRVLLAATAQLAGGNLKARTGIPYGQGELSQLAHAFDRMAEALARHETERSQAEQELHRLNRALKTLNECNQVLVRATEESEFLHHMCRIVVEVGGYRLAWVGLAEPDEARAIRPVAQAGFEAGYLETLNLTWADTARGQSPAGIAIRTGQPHLTRDIVTDPGFAPWREAAIAQGYAAAIALPLMANNGPFGALAIYATQPDAFDTEEVKLLTELANDMAYGITTLRMRVEHEQAVKALWASEEKFRSIVQSSPMGMHMYRLEADGRLIFVGANPAADSILGLDHTPLIGKTIEEAFPAHCKSEVPEKYRLVAAEGVVWHTEEIVYKDDTIEGVFEVYAFQTSPGMMTAMFLDITGRKQAEREIQRRNRELEVLNAIIAASASGMETEVILDTACRLLTPALNLSAATAALLNQEQTAITVVAEYRSSDLPAIVNRTISISDKPTLQDLLKQQSSVMIVDAQNDPRLAPVHPLLRQRGAASLLLLPLIIEGKVAGCFTLETAEPRQFSAEDIGLAWSVADQIAGALARIRLDRERRLLSTVIEQVVDNIIVTDVEGTILYVNPAFEQLSGYGSPEVIGQNVSVLKSGEHNPAFYAEMWSTINAGQVWRGRFINKKADGGVYTVDAIISPLVNEAGEIVTYISSQRDITRELQLEEQFRQAQKMEAVGRLTAGIAHDFNNMLTAINGFAELLLMRLPADNPHRDMVDHILGPGQRAANLVAQLLAFSRKQIIDPQVLDLNAVVAQTDKMLQRTLGEDIEIRTLLASDLWPIKVDPAQIEQTLVNLAVNARDAMPAGGQLTIETANVVLDKDYVAQHFETRPGQYVLLAVSDTGMGMSRDVLAHIFEPFFTTKEQGKGTGLGLATVFGIVKQNGGDIQVYSEEGVGTTFKIYLPRAEAAPAAATPKEQIDDIPRGTETILLVEDEPVVREVVRRVLHEQGYTLLEAQDAQEALHLAARFSGTIHLLLTDVVMPGMSGKALAQQLTQTYPKLKILFMSGYTDNAIVHHGVLEPGTAFIHKPFSAAALARKVRRVLDAGSAKQPS